MNKQNVQNPYKGILFIHKVEWTTDTWYHMGKRCKYAKVKKPIKKLPWFHAYESPELRNL